MADTTSRGPKGTKRRAKTGIPVRLVRGDTSSDELATVAALIAILATARGDGDADSTELPSPADWRNQSRWGSPRRLVRTTLPHGPGGWRASALSR